MHGRCQFCFPGVSDPETFEILACHKAVQMAIQIGVDKVHVEIDSKSIAAMLNDQGKNLSAAGQTVEEIKCFLRSTQTFKVSRVRRSSNRAHVLARVGVCNNICRI